jgi:hypothetical protein
MKNLAALVASKYPPRYCGKLVVFGQPSIEDRLLSGDWVGQLVRPLGFQLTALEKSLSATCLVGQLGIDPGFSRVMQGYWTRAFTVREVFDRFVGPHHLIVMNTDSMDRTIWATEQVQASAPHVYVLPEDGHNEAVRELAAKRKYLCEEADGYLVMSHDGVHDYCGVCNA